MEEYGADDDAEAAPGEDDTESMASEDDEMSFVQVQSEPSTWSGRISGVATARQARLKNRVRNWRNAAIALSHFGLRHQEPLIKEKNLVAYAKERLLSLSVSGQLGVADAGKLPKRMIHVADGIKSCPHENHPILHRGWARRPPNGKMYGAKYIRIYEDDIREMFDRGASDKGDKLGAGRMLEQLRARYPQRFNLPSESEIRVAVSRLFVISRKRKCSVVEADGAQSKRRRMPHEYSNVVEELVGINSSLMPSQAVPLFRSRFPGSEAVLDDKQVRSKVSTIKRKIQTTGGL